MEPSAPPPGGIIRGAPHASGGPALDTNDPQQRSGRRSRQRGGDDRPPGLRAQLGITRDAAIRLIQAHIELARTEIPAIVENVKAVALAAAVAVGLAFFALTLLSIGWFLWAGEWLFGSMGWGVVHGVALAVSVIVACVGLILAEPARTIARDVVVSIVIAIVVSIVFGMSLTNAAWAQLTDAIAPSGIAPEWQLLAVAVGVSAVVVGIVGLILGAIRGGAGGLVGGLLAGAVLGAAIGAFTAIAFGPQVGIALGILGGYIAFVILQAVGIARRGVDPAALQARFYPTQTIETAKETLEWLQEQTSGTGR